MRYKVLLNSAMRGQPVALNIEADGIEVTDGCLCFNRREDGGSPGAGLVFRVSEIFRVYAPGVWRAVEVLDENAPTGAVDIKAQRREMLGNLIPDDPPEGNNEASPGVEKAGSVQEAR